MNKVSDLKLALACHEAGIVPSLSAFNYHHFSTLKNDLEEFIRITGSDEILISVDSNILSEYFLEYFKDIKLRYLEFTEWDPTQLDRKVNVLTSLHNEGTRFIFKTTRPYRISDTIANFPSLKNIFDCVMLKGPDGAGSILPDKHSLEEMVSITKSICPETSMITSGGIYLSTDIKKFLDMGVAAVGLGTVIAASEESKLSTDAKEKLVAASSDNIVKLQGNYNCQNAIVFSEVESSPLDKNRSKSLTLGVRTGNTGHLFIGKGVDSISAILPLKQIVENLVKDL